MLYILTRFHWDILPVRRGGSIKWQKLMLYFWMELLESNLEGDKCHVGEEVWLQYDLEMLKVQFIVCSPCPHLKLNLGDAFGILWYSSLWITNRAWRNELMKCQSRFILHWRCYNHVIHTNKNTASSKSCNNKHAVVLSQIQKSGNGLSWQTKYSS